MNWKSFKEYEKALINDLVELLIKYDAEILINRNNTNDSIILRSNEFKEEIETNTDIITSKSFII